MDTLYTFWDNSTHYKTESVHFSGLMNSATKECFLAPLCLVVPALTAGSPNAEASYRLFVGGGMLLSAVFRTPCCSYVRELFIATSWSEKQCMFSFLRSHRGSFSTWQSVPCSRVPSAPSSSPAPPATRWSVGTRFNFPYAPIDVPFPSILTGYPQSAQPLNP